MLNNSTGLEIAKSRISHLTDLAAVFVAATSAAFIVFAWLGGDHLVGDEHNAIYFLRDGFWDYISNFHYGQLLKAQFWTIHEIFGNSFFWYRVPAALSTALFASLLLLFRLPILPPNRPTQALVVLTLLGNAQLVFFGRWGMPNYGESILLEALLLTWVARDLAAAEQVNWSWSRVLVMAALPWIYPATPVVLGAMSGWLLLLLLGDYLRNGLPSTGRCLRQLWVAFLPILLGALSLALYRLSVPDAHWARARGHHASFSDWVAADKGGILSFVGDSLGTIGKDLVTLTPVRGPYATSLSNLYTVVACAVGLGIIAALLLAGVRFARKNIHTDVIDHEFVRAGGFLAACVLFSILAVVSAQLLDAFPAGGGLRHVFFLIPPLALLAVVSCAYLTHRGRRALPNLLIASVRVVSVIGLVLLGSLLCVTVGQTRYAVQRDFDSLFALFDSPKNDLSFSFAPGFFISPALRPNPDRYFMTDAGRSIPGPIQQALQGAESVRRMAVLVKTNELDSSDSALNEFIADYDLAIDRVAHAGHHSVVALIIPSRDGKKRQPVSIDFSVEIPQSAISSIRLDPTEFVNSTVKVNDVELVNSATTHPIDLCNDKRLTLVRSSRVAERDGCLLLLGDGNNSGWVAPSGLRDLPASSERRWLRVQMTGHFSDQFRVYADTGAGYTSIARIDTDQHIVEQDIGVAVGTDVGE